MPKDQNKGAAKKTRNKGLVRWRYEGGQWVSPSTLSRHRRDDRLLRTLQGGQQPLKDVNNPPRGHGSSRQEPDEKDWVPLIDIQLELLSDLQLADNRHGLVFTNDPKTSGPYVSDSDLDQDLTLFLPNTGRHALRLNDDTNSTFLRVENDAWELFRVLHTLPQDDRVLQLKGRFRRLLRRLDGEKKTHWMSQRSGGVTGEAIFVWNDHHFQPLAAMHPSVRAASLACLVLQDIHFLSRRALQIHLASLRDMLRISGVPPGVIEQLPKDPRSISSKFHLDPHTVTYLVCPTCHALYLFKQVHFRDSVDCCQYKPTPTSSPCNTSLWKEAYRGPSGTAHLPIKKFVFQPLRSWLGRMISRPEIEILCQTRPLPNVHPSHDDDIEDIWSSSEFSNLRGVDGLPFYTGMSEGLKLVFSLSIDGFGPFGNKTAKQSAASTGIWMVLLNLPQHLRYLPENIYLAGIIPGPTKPSNDQINHYIQLVVNELKEFGGSGVFYSRTFERPQGRLVHALLIPLVCDLLAARQVIGYPGTTTAHYFCTSCDLDYHDIQTTDPQQWPPKDVSHIRQFAQLYRDANSEAEQKVLFSGCGWRWSPLLELEYWDPVRYTVIDSMHSLDHNMLKNHCRVLFEIDQKHQGGTALRPPFIPRNHKVDLRKPRHRTAWLQCQQAVYDNSHNLLYLLLEFDRRVLYTFSVSHDIRHSGYDSVVGTRWVLAKNICLWRQTSPPSMSLSSFLDTFSVDPHEAEPDSHLSDGDDDDDDDDLASEGDQIEEETRQPKAEIAPEVPSGSKDLPSYPKLARFVQRLVGDRTPNLYRALSVRILAHFLDVAELDREHISLKARDAKKKLYEILIASIDADRNNDGALGRLTRVYTEGEKVSSRSAAFLGVDVMERVWADMKLTRLPSWVTPAPTDWGTVRRGKLSADNWRVVCCIHLPITLIRLFGKSEGRKKELLDNYMDLVSAVRVATSRRISPAGIARYDELMSKYTEDVKRLYPDYQVLPSHHASLHIGDMLRRFGPKHSHDSPHYERYINFLHRINNNNKIGDLDGTFLRTSARHSNLKFLLAENKEVTHLMWDMVGRLGKVDKERARGFQLTSHHQVTNESLSQHHVGAGQGVAHLEPHEFEMLCEILQEPLSERNVYVSSTVTSIDAISLQGALYASFWTRHYRDSSIFFQHDRRHSQCAGTIQKIFRHLHTTASGDDGSSVYLVVEVMPSLSTEEDPYRQFGFAGGFLCGAGPRELLMISPIHLISHAAVTEFSETSTTHVLPINREMLPLEESLELLQMPGD